MCRRRTSPGAAAGADKDAVVRHPWAGEGAGAGRRGNSLWSSHGGRKYGFELFDVNINLKFISDDRSKDTKFELSIKQAEKTMLLGVYYTSLSYLALPYLYLIHGSSA